MAESSDKASANADTRRVIHDLRQPLAAMQMWLDLLDGALHGQLGDKEGRYLAKLRAEMTRMTGLLNSSGTAAAADTSALSADARVARQPGAIASREERRLAGLSLLLVEDDEMTAEALQLALEGEGASVAVSATVAGSLALFSALRPDAVLSDLKLSDGDGFSLVRQIRLRNHADGGHTAAFAVTGFDSDDTRAACHAAGFDALVLKPFAIDDLVELVANSIAARR